MNDNVKALVPLVCPHCKKEVMASFRISTPEMLAAYTPEDLQRAKNDAVMRAEEIMLPVDEKKSFIDWVMSPETVFGPEDVDEIIKNLTNDSAKESDA